MNGIWPLISHDRYDHLIYQLLSSRWRRQAPRRCRAKMGAPEGGRSGGPAAERARVRARDETVVEPAAGYGLM